MFCVVLRDNLKPRAEWPAELTSGHHAWVKKEYAAGNLIVSGPTPDRKRAIYVVKADSIAAAHALVQADPFIGSGCCGVEILEWDIQEGAELFAVAASR